MSSELYWGTLLEKSKPVSCSGSLDHDSALAREHLCFALTEHCAPGACLGDYYFQRLGSTFLLLTAYRKVGGESKCLPEVPESLHKSDSSAYCWLALWDVETEEEVEAELLHPARGLFLWGREARHAEEMLCVDLQLPQGVCEWWAPDFLAAEFWPPFLPGDPQLSPSIVWGVYLAGMLETLISCGIS